MFLPGSTPTQTSLTIGSTNLSAMNHNQQQQFLFDQLKDHRSSKFSPSAGMSRKAPNFSLDPDLLRELNARYLHDINASRPANVNPDGPALLLPPFLRAEHYHQHTHTHEHNLNIFTPPSNALLNEKLSKPENSLSSFLRTTNNFVLPPPPLFSSVNSPTPQTTKESSSPPAKKSTKWCAAHVRISWMIYHQQQRAKEKFSPSESKKDDEQKLPDFNSTSKQVQSAVSVSTSDLSLPLPPSYPVPPSFNFRSPFEFAGGPFGRVVPSSNTAFGGLGSLFDRKPDLNGASMVPAAHPALDWSRFHRPLVPAGLAANNDNAAGKKLEEMPTSHNDKKRSSSQLMLPPSHLTNSNRSRSRSPHRLLHQHPYPLSMNPQNKSSTSPPTRKRTSPIVKSSPGEMTSKNVSHFPPPPFATGFDPLTLSMIERQRLSMACASLFGVPPGSMPANLFAHLDASSAMNAALMQREHFLNSLRTSQQEQLLLATKKKNNSSSEESSRITPPKVTTSPGSHSSTSSSSSSKKSSHVKRVKSSSSPALSTDQQESTGKAESISISS